jgi:flavin reductase (DIM6/NTAB) family NADH-FMN oxidoreductase RutF
MRVATDPEQVINERCDSLVAQVDPPLLVVTTASRDQRAGCVIGFHTQCSIEPRRYAIWMSKANFTYRVSLFATHVAMHFLDAADHDIAELFGGTSGDHFDKFDEVEWAKGPGGVPLLARCPNRIVLERGTMWDDGSDHVCFVGAVADAAGSGGFAPLRLSDAVDIAAGHLAEERNMPAALVADAGDTASNVSASDDHLGDARRHDLEQLAAGAGHPVDLSDDQEPVMPDRLRRR